MDFAVRRCTASDASTIASLGARLFVQAYGPTHPEPELSQYLTRAYSVGRLTNELKDEAVSFFLAGDSQANAIGYAQLCVSDGPLPKGVVGKRAYEVHRFYVDSSWHGRGVANALMDACYAETRRAGGDTIWLQVFREAPRAVAFYQRTGYSVVGSAPFHFGSRADEDYIMSRLV